MLTQGLSFGGLASGLDTKQIIEQLMAIEHRPVDMLAQRQNHYEDLLEAWREVNSKLLSLKSVAENLSELSAFHLYSSSSEDEDIVTLSTTTDAQPGSHSIRVLQLAQPEKLASAAFSDSSEALGLSGEFLVNGKVVNVESTYSLLDIRDAINNADADVTASVLAVDDDTYQLILSADDPGSDGFDLLDASGSDVLQSLGFSVGTETWKNQIDGGAATDYFSSRTSAIKTILGLTNAPSGTIQINGVDISIDLATDSLNDIKDKIDAAGITGVSTSITTDTSSSTTKYRLEITGATSFTDSNNVLETLGVLEADFSQGKSQVLTGSATNYKSDGVTPIDSSTKWSEIYGANVQNGDTITISGTDHDGNSVSGTYTISDVNDTVQGFLSYIESLFGDVTAAFDSSGKLQITDNEVGQSQLAVTITENNEGGGSLNFGTMSVSTYGYDIQLAEGQDARFEIDGVLLTRSSNVISDALDGVTFTLHKADSSSTVNVSVTRDLDSVKQKIQDFAQKYNDIVQYINQQFTYNEDTQESGTLFADVTLKSIQSSIRRILVNEVEGLPSSMNALAQVGITTDRNGLLQIDDADLTDALEDNFNQVVRLFIGEGTATDSDIQVLDWTKNTKPGTYDVVITQAAEQASVTGSADLTSGLSSDTTLTITDYATGWQATVNLYAGDTIDTIVSRINTELSTEYNQQLTSSNAMTASGNPITTSTLLTDIDTGSNPAFTAGDTIRISGKEHDNGDIEDSFTVEADSTVQDLLRAIQDAYGGEVVASVDSSGHIVIEDVTTGRSYTTLELTRYHDDTEYQDFGTFDTTVTGRYSLGITASNESGHLKITHTAWGSSNGFTISESGSELGITAGTYQGVDVAGTINGEEATGSGRVLTGDSDQTNIADLSILVTLTADQLASQGQDQGSVTITKGVAAQMEDHLDFITDSHTGYASQREEVLQDIIDDIQDRIDMWEERLALRRIQLEQRFTNLERMLSTMNSLSSYLGSQIANLGG